MKFPRTMRRIKSGITKPQLARRQPFGHGFLMKIALAFGLVLALASCGKNETAALSGTSGALLTSLSVKFEPVTRELVVTGLLNDSKGTGETEFFYYTGKRESGAVLKDPIEKTTLTLLCDFSDCSSLSFFIKGKRLALNESVKVKILSVSSARSEIDARDFTGDTFATSWKELLRHGIDPAQSSICVSRWANKTFHGILLTGASRSLTHWVHVSGESAAQMLSVDYSYEGKSGPIYTLGTEPGTVGSDGPTPWVIGLPGGRYFLFH